VIVGALIRKLNLGPQIWINWANEGVHFLRTAIVVMQSWHPPRYSLFNRAIQLGGHLLKKGVPLGADGPCLIRKG